MTTGRKGVTVAEVLAVFAGAVIVGGCVELTDARRAVGLGHDTAKLARAIAPRKRTTKRATLSPELRAAVRESQALAKVEHPTPAQRARAAELNALFERDMRERDGLRAEWPGR